MKSLDTNGRIGLSRKTRQVRLLNVVIVRTMPI